MKIRCKYLLIILSSAFLMLQSLSYVEAQIHKKAMQRHVYQFSFNETSPYLLQHVRNSVNWYPWGEEALAFAKRENKPLLISIGYCACHCCYMMQSVVVDWKELVKIH